jgi:purine-binding chemotaxis protein CheW
VEPHAKEGPKPSTDPLESFFWREDEETPVIPDVGLGGAARSVVAADVEERREFLTFHLGVEEYAVSVDRVREILRSPPITEVPRAPGHLLGVVAVRGEIIAIVDPRPRLGLPRTEQARMPPIVVCESADGPAGLIVDRLAQVVRLPPSAIEPRPATLGSTAAEAIAGVGREGDRLIILLDLDALLRPAAAPGEVGRA